MILSNFENKSRDKANFFNDNERIRVFVNWEFGEKKGKTLSRKLKVITI